MRMKFLKFIEIIHYQLITFSISLGHFIRTRNQTETFVTIFKKIFVTISINRSLIKKQLALSVYYYV